jgi:hypothetical protein
MSSCCYALVPIGYRKAWYLCRLAMRGLSCSIQVSRCPDVFRSSAYEGQLSALYTPALQRRLYVAILMQGISPLCPQAFVGRRIL